MFEPGAIVAKKFRIEGILGAGGMGVVAIATHLQLEQRVALKVLNDAAAADHSTVERFLREARAAAKLKSEHVCRVSDVGQLDTGAPYIVMELLEGRDLAHTLADRPLAPDVAVDYVVQACVAIAEAHASGIVHRDLKPANLFVTRRLDGSPLVKVLDFGIAKATADATSGLTRTDTVMGTPGYMAPEQLRSTRDVDARCDIWALGVILYQAIAGRVPFPATSLTEFAVKIAMDPPDPIDVDPALRAILLRCLEKEPAQRYRNVAMLAQALVPFGGASVRANAALAAKLLANSAAGGGAPPADPLGATVATTLQSAATAIPTKPARKPWWIAAVLAAAVAGGGIVLAVIQRAQPAPGPTVAVAAVVTSDAATPDVAMPDVAPPPAQPVDAGALATAPTPVMAPAIKHQPSPKPTVAPAPVAPAAVAPAPAKVDPNDVSAFEAAIASHHCTRAAELSHAIVMAGGKYMQELAACRLGQARAFNDFANPNTEPWVIAQADELVAAGNPTAAQKQLDAYYFARTGNACQHHDAAVARVAFAKIKNDKDRELVLKTCNAFHVAIE